VQAPNILQSKINKRIAATLISKRTNTNLTNLFGLFCSLSIKYVVTNIVILAIVSHEATIVPSSVTEKLNSERESRNIQKLF